MEVVEFKDKTRITVSEINVFVDKYFKKIIEKPEEAPEKLEVSFSDNLEEIDELFYAYLLLFKQSFQKKQENKKVEQKIDIKIVLDIPTNKPKQIAMLHAAYLNAYYSLPFMSIKGEKPLEINELKSVKFFQPILVTKDSKSPGIFDFFDRDKLKELLSEEKFAERNNDISWLIQNASRKWKEQDKKRKTKELILARDLKSAVSSVTREFWYHFYRIEILSHLGVLEDYLTEKPNDVIKQLSDNNFFTISQIQTYFFYLLTMQFGKKNLKKNYKNILYDLFEKTKKINFGLKELATNITQHTEDGFGVISARIHKKGKVDELKNFDEKIKATWSEKHKKDSNVLTFLDINVIDAGEKGVTKNYIEKIETEKREYEAKATEPNIYVELANALEKDIDTIKTKGYGFSNFLNYEKIKLLHQTKRINARMGLLIFSSLVCKNENGIVKAASTNAEGAPEGAYFYQDEKLQEHKLSDNDTRFVRLGTNYNFILPIYKKRVYSKTVKQDKTEQGVPTSLLNALFKYEKTDYNENSLLDLDENKTYVVELKGLESKYPSEKYEKIFEIGNKIKESSEYYKKRRKKNAKNDIIFINATDLTKYRYTSSDWLRFLSNIQLFSSIPLIVYNMPKEEYDEIIEIFKIFTVDVLKTQDKEGKENRNNPILFYLKHGYGYQKKQEKDLTLWFCNVLAGDSYDDYLALNQTISHYQHNLYSIQDDGIKNNNFDSGIISNSPLFSDGKLLNFELLIKNEKTGLTLFEESVSSLLNLEIRTLPDIILNKAEEELSEEERFFYRFKGFKVSDSHFRIGAKLHINSYYYGKRLFYNSFYANRFAFLIAKYLLEKEVKKEEAKIDNDKITLIGYSHYSELLVSNVKRLLESVDKKYTFNHDVVLDDDNVLKNASDIQDKVIIIVPISSSFSTSFKIQKALEKARRNFGKGAPKIVNEEMISVLLVADVSFEGKCAEDKTNKKIKKWWDNFGWRIKDKADQDRCRNAKIITIRNNDKDYEQKYFIPLYSEWNLIHECELCFPEVNKRKKEKEEKCLLETGANAVSPESIFGFPVTLVDESCDNCHKTNCDKKIDIRQYFRRKLGENESFFLKKYIRRNENHYKHFIKADSFLEKPENKLKVRKWLAEGVKTIFNDDKKYIIITPSRTANSGFVNMVNEQVFSEAATILQYSHTDDILQNFIRFNTSFFDDEATVIFVDDVLHTAKSFRRINNYIKHISANGKRKVSADYCIVLFNSTSYFDYKETQRNLSDKGMIFSYANINLPPVKITNYEFPDEKRLALFKKLSESSVTDMMKLYFAEQRDDMMPFDFDNSTSYFPKGNLDDLFHFCVFKSLYSFFALKTDDTPEFDYTRHDEIVKFTEKDKKGLLETLIKFVRENKDVDDLITYIKTEREIDYATEELKTKIIYICSTAPFSYYKDIREFAFYRVSRTLKYFAKVIIRKQNDREFFAKIHNRETSPFCFFERFKLYLRLAADLKINYIFSVEMLKAINILLDNWDTEGIKRESRSKSKPTDKIVFDEDKPEPEYETVKKDYDIGFITYYLSIVEQLIKEDEAKAAKVVQNIVTIIKSKNGIKRRKEQTGIKPDTLVTGANDEKLTLRDSFNNKFVDLLRNMVIENTFIFSTFINEFLEEEKPKYTFEKAVIGLADFIPNESEGTKGAIATYYEKKQTARWQSLSVMLARAEKYEEKNKEEYLSTFFYIDDEKWGWMPDPKLKEAFYKTVYLKTLLDNDKNEKKITDNNKEKEDDNGTIRSKTKTILKYLSEILGINEDECPRGGAYFTIRHRSYSGPEKKIDTSHLYTMEPHAINKIDSLGEVDLIAKNSLVFQLYKGIKETYNKKPTSLIELIYDEKENGNKYNYKHTDYEKYYDDNPADKEPVISNSTLEISNASGHKYNNLLFLRITDINEDEKFSGILEE